MTYQVLARKYRPQFFKDVIGQDHVTKTLVNALAAGRMHHAYLFTGARGTGKTTVARILAKALNCEKKGGSEPCGSCGPCTEIANGTSLDVQEIDGASNTGVDDVRELRERTKYLPSSGRYKIYIIDEVHMLTGNAFNALLKTLEEPPSHVIFIFATTEAHKIPATILSRCQRYDFRRIPASAIVATLSRIAADEGIKADDGALNLVAREATGSLRDAESLLDQAIAFSGDEINSDTVKGMLGFLDRKLLFDMVGAIVTRDAKQALAILDEIFSQGADLNRFAMDVLELLRHLLVLTECGDERGAVDVIPDELAMLKGLLFGNRAPSATKPLADRTPSLIHGPELHQMFSLWYRVAEEVSRSPFPKMLLEVGLIRLCRVGPVKQIEDIVARLDALVSEKPEVEMRTGEKSAPGPLGAWAPEKVRACVPAKQQIENKDITETKVQKPETIVNTELQAAEPDHKPTFEAVVSPGDVVVERRWEEFMRWVAAERPQMASILQSGTLSGIDGGVVKIAFDNQLYADMLTEEARREQAEALFKSFFKKPMRLSVSLNATRPKCAAPAGAAKREMVREALGSDIVKQAADILNAQVHEVKVDK